MAPSSQTMSSQDGTESTSAMTDFSKPDGGTLMSASSSTDVSVPTSATTSLALRSLGVS